MKESNKEKSTDLYSTREVDTDMTVKSVKSDEGSVDAEALAALIVKQIGKWGDIFLAKKVWESYWLIQLKEADTDKNPCGEWKGDGKCFNCGSTEHFARECKMKKNPEAFYKAKYESLVAKLHEKNPASKVLIVKE